jgi:hypothetical protein
LIYFVDGPSSSVVHRIRPSASLGPAGTTRISEGMHNLLKMGGGLHGAGGMGLAAATVYSTTQLTSRNKQLLAPVMGTRIPQNTSFL